MRQIYIYTLSDPRDDLIKYVGKTVNLKSRLNNHLSTNHKNKCSSWIKSLKSKGLKPVMEVVDECTKDEWVLMEQYWISQFKAWNFPLKNIRDGGDSIDIDVIYKPRTTILSEQTRNRMSVSHTGMTHSEDMKVKIGKGISKAKREKNNKNRVIVQCDKTTLEPINKFTTIAEASELFGTSVQQISNCARGTNGVKSAAGYMWKWENILTN